MKKVLILLSSFLILASCENESSSTEEAVTAIKIDGEKSIAEIIRSPVNANEPLDTVNVAKMTFKETNYNFGTIKEGKVVSHVYTFTNTGKVPLVINDARSTCGCTVPKWPEEPIPPGDSGKISVRFDSKGKKDRQSKPITITANTYPNQTVLHISGTVIPK